MYRVVGSDGCLIFYFISEGDSVIRECTGFVGGVGGVKCVGINMFVCVYIGIFVG